MREYTLYVHFTCCVQCTKIPFDLNSSGGNFLGTFEAFKMPQQILGGKISKKHHNNKLTNCKNPPFDFCRYILSVSETLNWIGCIIFRCQNYKMFSKRVLARVHLCACTPCALLIVHCKQCKGPFLQCIFMSNAALRIRLWLLLQTLLFFANYSQLLVPMRVWENYVNSYETLNNSCQHFSVWW